MLSQIQGFNKGPLQLLAVFDSSIALYTWQRFCSLYDTYHSDTTFAFMQAAKEVTGSLWQRLTEESCLSSYVAVVPSDPVPHGPHVEDHAQDLAFLVVQHFTHLAQIVLQQQSSERSGRGVTVAASAAALPAASQQRDTAPHIARQSTADRGNIEVLVSAVMLLKLIELANSVRAPHIRAVASAVPALEALWATLSDTISVIQQQVCPQNPSPGQHSEVVKNFMDQDIQEAKCCSELVRAITCVVDQLMVDGSKSLTRLTTLWRLERVVLMSRYQTVANEVILQCKLYNNDLYRTATIWYHALCDCADHELDCDVDCLVA